MEPKIKVQQIAHHRNGVGGVPFYVVLFTDPDVPHQMVGIVFEEPESRQYVEPHTAVLDVVETMRGNIGFGDGNSFRGDVYDPALREAITAWSAARAAAIA